MIELIDDNNNVVFKAGRGDYDYYYLIYFVVFAIVVVMVAATVELFIPIDPSSTAATLIRIVASFGISLVLIRALSRLLPRENLVLRRKDVEGKTIRVTASPYFGVHRKFKVVIPDYQAKLFLVRGLVLDDFLRILEEWGADLRVIRGRSTLLLK